MEYGYSRTSTGGQDGEGQLLRLAQAGIPPERIFFDRGISGMKASRPEFDRMTAVLQPGDIVVTPELSRLGRSVKNVLGMIEDFEDRGIGLRIQDLSLDTTTPVGRMVVTVLAAIARLERDLISERTKAALAVRKAQGVKLGGPRKLDDKQTAAVRMMREAGIEPEKIAPVFGISRTSVYRYLSDRPA